VLKKDDTDGAAAATTTSTALIGIPNVVGMTFDVASTTISELGLEPELVPQENPDVPESQVFSTSPLANTLVEAGSIVQIFYRPSKDPQPVPDLTGKNVEEAKRILTEQGFVAGTTTTETSDLTPDTVIRTDPAANTVVKAGSTVNIVLSAGPATVPVPPVTLQAVDVAKAFLEADPRNFVVTVVEQPDPEIPAGTVISQDPAAGSDLAPGAAITLVVSSGPQKVPVPPVVGLKEGEARNSITGVGLVATVQYQSLPSGDVNDGLVIAQTPSAGVDVDPGATVNLKVGKAVAPPSTTTSTTTTTLPPTTTTSTTTTTTVAPTIAPTAPPGP